MTSKPNASAKMEILITGFGGQGIVLAGQIVGKAASLIDHKESTLTQSYGPEARGGACSAQVIISDGFIHFPYVRQPDILVCMSQGGFDKYADVIKETSILIVDQNLVNTGDAICGRCFAIPGNAHGRGAGQKDDGQYRHGGIFYGNHPGHFAGCRPEHGYGLRSQGNGSLEPGGIRQRP